MGKMENKGEDLGGRAKEAVGDLTKNKDMQREGRNDQRSASAKDGIDKAGSAIKDGVDNVKNAFKSDK